MVELHVSGDPDNPVLVDHQHAAVGRGRVVILPSNDRPVLTEAEIAAERAKIAQEDMIPTAALSPAVIEAATDDDADE
jgi:hypothetical protein